VRFEVSKVRPLQAVCSYRNCGLVALNLFNGLVTGRAKHGKYAHAFAVRFIDLLDNFLRHASPAELEAVQKRVAAEVENRSTMQGPARGAA